VPFSIDKVAPQDETKTRTFTILGHETEVTYYPNRLTLEGNVDYDDAAPEGDDEEDLPEDDDAQRRVAATTCRTVAAWDWTGPVKRGDGTVIVGADEPVPLDPDVVRCIPTRVIRGLNRAIAQQEFPDPNRKTRRAQRSSRR
jgi:hypothetical protein